MTINALIEKLLKLQKEGLGTQEIYLPNGAPVTEIRMKLVLPD